MMNNLGKDPSTERIRAHTPDTYINAHPEDMLVVYCSSSFPTSPCQLCTLLRDVQRNANAFPAHEGRPAGTQTPSGDGASHSGSCGRSTHPHRPRSRVLRTTSKHAGDIDHLRGDFHRRQGWRTAFRTLLRDRCPACSVEEGRSIRLLALFSQEAPRLTVVSRLRMPFTLRGHTSTHSYGPSGGRLTRQYSKPKVLSTLVPLIFRWKTRMRLQER